MRKKKKTKTNLPERNTLILFLKVKWSFPNTLLLLITSSVEKLNIYNMFVIEFNRIAKNTIGKYHQNEINANPQPAISLHLLNGSSHSARKILFLRIRYV